MISARQPIKFPRIPLFYLQSRYGRIPRENTCSGKKSGLAVAFTLCAGRPSRFWVMSRTCAQHAEWMPQSLLRPSKSGGGMRRDAVQRLTSFWPAAINHLLLHTTLPILTPRPLTHLVDDVAGIRCPARGGSLTLYRGWWVYLFPPGKQLAPTGHVSQCYIFQEIQKCFHGHKQALQSAHRTHDQGSRSQWGLKRPKHLLTQKWRA